MDAERAKIPTATVGAVTWVSPSGELDLADCDELEHAIAAGPVERGRVVYVDLSETTFIDASVLGALVRSGRRLAATESKLKIFGASGMVADLLALTKIDVEYGADLRVPDATVTDSLAS